MQFNGVLPTSAAHNPVKYFHVGRNKDCAGISASCLNVMTYLDRNIKASLHWHIYDLFYTFLSVSGVKKSHQTSDIMHTFVVLSIVFKHLMMGFYIIYSKKNQAESLFFHLGSKAFHFYKSWCECAGCNSKAKKEELSFWHNISSFFSACFYM